MPVAWKVLGPDVSCFSLGPCSKVGFVTSPRFKAVLSQSLLPVTQLVCPSHIPFNRSSMRAGLGSWSVLLSPVPRLRILSWREGPGVLHCHGQQRGPLGSPGLTAVLASLPHPSLSFPFTEKATLDDHRKPNRPCLSPPGPSPCCWPRSPCVRWR